MSARFGSASPQSLVLLFVQCVSLFFLLIYVAAQQTNAEQQQQQQQQSQQVKARNNNDDENEAAAAAAVASIELHQNLRFEPALIDFGQWPVGTAHSHTVTIINQHLNRSVLLNSVSGRTPSFYSSFFEHKIIAPQSNTTFQVVFLPRENGNVDTELHIHSSFGQARLTVRGVGRECPYRLRPLTGIKAPLNATLTPEINMYNPHDQPLQILEIYSSGGQFQLELPSGGLEGPQALWAIPAYTEKPIIRMRFHARNAGNFSAYIRIKIAMPADNESDTETVLVIPVEFEILEETGLYAENPLLDFGSLSSDNAYRASAPKIKLQLKQSNEQHPHDFIGLNMRILAGLIFDPADNSITLDPRKFNESIILDELILLRAAYKRNISALQEFTVRLRAHIFKGSLNYKQNITTFLTHLSDNAVNERGSDSGNGCDSRTERQLIVQNDFQVPLAIYNVSVIPHLDSNIFNLQLMPKFDEKTQILQPGNKINLLHVKLLNATLPYTSKLLLHTNISTYEIPLAVCSGHLHVVGHNTLHIPLNVAYNASLHLGAIPNVEVSHQGWVMLINQNPTGIRLNNWNFESPRGFSFQVALMGCVRNIDKYLKHEPPMIPIETVEFRFCNYMAAGDVVIYEVALQEYIAENKDGTLNIWTPYEHIKVAVRFHSWKGKIELVQDKVHFPNCFPGKTCTSDIYIISGLPIAIELGSIEFNNDYFKFKNLNHTATTIIQPRTVTKIGRVQFEAHKICPTRCYIPPYDRLTNKRIAFPGPRPNKSGDSLLFEELELRRRTELYRQLKWYLQTVVFTLTTRNVYQFKIPMPISSEWPKLVLGGRQLLPLVEVGKAYVHNIIVRNPADVPLLVDYFISDQRAPNAAHLSLPLEVMDLSASCLPTNRPVFNLATPVLREPLLIPANSNISLPIRFESDDVDSYCTLLHLRNNLTLYEPVWISAKTVQPQFRFGNRKPGNTTPMMFEIKEAHLTACHEEFPALPLVAVKRSFTARNAGELPILIESFHIGEYTCEGYGFKVLDCQSFELKANSSRKIEISFTPDFTLTRVQRPLILHTNLSSVQFNYELLATLPAINLDICSRKLPRPAWEKSVRNAVMMLMASTFIFVILATHIDYTNIMYSQTLLYNVRQRGPIYPTFNLRNIMPRQFQVRNTNMEDDANNLMTNTDNTQNNNNNNNSGGNSNGTMSRHSSLNGQTNGANQNNNNNSNTSNSAGSNNHVRRRGRKSGTNSNSPAVGIGRNMSITTSNALEAGLLQNLIIMSNNPNDNRVIVVAPKRRDSTPSPIDTPISSPTTVKILPEASTTTWPSTQTDSEPPSPLSRNNDVDKENDRESGISISSTTSAEMDTSLFAKKKQQQQLQQHVSRTKRSKLLAQDKKAEREREREKLRERQLEKEREQEKLKKKDQEKEKRKEREREREKEKAKEREKHERQQQEKERLEKVEQEKERERQKDLELIREKEREREKDRIRKLLESEKQKEIERERERQRLLERKKDLQQKETEIRQREKLKEMEQQQLLNLERENERKVQLQKEMEKERQLKMNAEMEREKQKELKRQRERALELEREREKQKEIEREKERKKEKERRKERQREIEKERKKEKETQKKIEKFLKASTETLEGSTKNPMTRDTNHKITEKEKDNKFISKYSDEKEKASKNLKISKEDTEKIIDENQQAKQQDDKDLTPPLKVTQTEVTRKYGKTPGRERRKDANTQIVTNTAAPMCQEDVNNYEVKKHNKKAVQSLLFGAVSPAATSHNNNNNVNGSGSNSETTSPNCLARSPWEAGSQVSLGDLIHKHQNLNTFNRSNPNLTENIKKSAASISSDNNNNNNHNNSNANELGPIGSRKSPSSTPLWESVQKQQQQQQLEKPQFPKPIITNNSSFFSNLPGSGSPNLNSFGLGDGQFMGIPTNLYELQKVQMELQRQLQTNEFIINLHQQQQLLQQQQELLQGAGDIATATTAAIVSNNQQWATTTTINTLSNSNNNNNTNSKIISHDNSNNTQNNNNNNNINNNGGVAWSPMGYRQAVDLNLVNNVNNNHSIEQVAQSCSNNNDNIMGLRINNGLNNHVLSNSNISVGTDGIRGLAPWQQLGLTRPPPGLNASPNNLQQTHFQPLQQQQQQQHQGQAQQQQQQPVIQQFDPFKSLSSIWSDNWNRNDSN